MAPIATTRRRRRREFWSLGNALLTYSLLVFCSLVCVLPFLWMLSTSFKAQGDVFRLPPTVIPSPLVLEGYTRVFHDIPFVRYIANSLLVSLSITLGQLVCNTLAAYAFAKIAFRGSNLLFLIYLATLMIPSQVTIIPSYVLMQYFGWVDTYYALTLPFMFGSAFGTFLLRQFFLTIPSELEDAARLDGAGYLGILWWVAVPLARPAIATFAVFSFMYFWNDFMWPLLVTNSEAHKTLTVGLATLSRSYFGTDWPTLMAGSTLSVLPVLLLFAVAQRYFVQGIALTGLKG